LEKTLSPDERMTGRGFGGTEMIPVTILDIRFLMADLEVK